MGDYKSFEISKLVTYDLRFPTSLTLAGSDAVHTNPDYSCAYVVIELSESDKQGHGLTFTCGRGTEIVVTSIEALSYLVEGKKLGDIFDNFAHFWKTLTNEEQLRWIGPEKGAIHLAVAAIVNALWDLWAKLENKPLWKLLADMKPNQIVSLINFSYLSNALTKEEALEILTKNEETKSQRENEILEKGLPAYITSAGWLGYDDEKIKRLCKEALDEGWKSFKMKVGNDSADNIRRAEIIRSCIGYDNLLMTDCNQIWEPSQAIEKMIKLAKFKPLWIEEPTSPDDVEGHIQVSEGLSNYGIGVATGEHVQNRIIFKQLFQANAVQFCQIDACRVGGVNEILAILLMAAKFKVPVCPHAGGIGLCEYVPHLAAFNYLYVSPTFDKVMVEYVGHLHEHFIDPARVTKGRYITPTMPGYSATMKSTSIVDYSYPKGKVWKRLIESNQYIPIGRKK